MKTIHVLDSKTINKIAAGEVIEKPASVVKELVENSIDAKANNITVEVMHGGISSIRISDDGIGINKEDIETAFLRHATSKIKDDKDLNTINTLGFRGEALASIACVSKVEVISKTKDSLTGRKVYIDGGKIIKSEDCGCPDGTTITVKELFFNTPARLKFLKSESREGIYITEVVQNLALSHPNVSFRYKANEKSYFITKGDGDLKSAILSIYGKEIYNNIIYLNSSVDFIRIEGYVGNSTIARASRTHQSIFINGRYIKNKTITAAVETAFKSMLTINKFPFFILNIYVNPEFIDVNVHPSKLEIKFQDEQMVFKAVYKSVKDVLLSKSDILEPPIKFTSNVPPMYFKQGKMDVFNDKDENLYSSNKNEQNEGDRIKENNDVNSNINSNGAEIDSPEIKVSPSKIEPLSIVGQLHFTYIIAEGKDELYMIDQHAAHERINYEKLLNEYKASSIKSQKLLTPIIIDLSFDEKETVNKNIDLFKNIGFEIDDFGSNSISIRAIPIIYGNPNIKDVFFEILSEININESDVLNTINKVIYTMACKSSIKAGDKLNNMEMIKLVEELRHCENPYTCPHGRPTIIKTTFYELEKKFKRVQ
ncbi:MAG TPA: DNA mismatch repair endonuclease MutL [Clostridiaceae bacterium]|jgi:DNA mismatch repair protein MutL|nr:DNA mismatch repair endonuclease MutL [Clostridiaceae bacterium]HBN29462.1 DNA mismatch repair endonuclease MutL [Clostridiaceae bacterium]HBX48869.1 DNA mismatch repair endonuclease MutL [Clostridiaceae bacterium]HCL51065.1 DNA mismatch repair endonuclease MutL [Clostridiaceae bacterium]